MPRTKKTPEQKIAALEGRVKTLTGAVLTLEGQTKELRSLSMENDRLQQEIVRLKAEMNQVRTSTKIVQDDLCLKLQGEQETTIVLTRKIRDREERLDRMRKVAVNEGEISRALAVALKAVL